MRILMVVLLCFVTFGCCSFQEHTGDFQEFLLVQLEEYGADLKPVQEGKLPLAISWKYKKDENGFLVIVEKNIYNELKSFFLQMYGSPSMISKNEKSYPTIVYDVRTSGVAIQFKNNEEGQTIIFCVKSL